MLLIGDIHLTSKIKDKLLSQLKSFVAQHNEEKNLIFLGDFVYHFSYDRNVLLELYDLFLEWYKQGKNLYILAGNHDRLGSTFVFEEGRKAFEILTKLQTNNDNEICFITQPTIKQIEGKQICFLPSMIEINELDFPGIESLKDEKYSELLNDKNKNIVFSAQLNLLVEWFTRKYSNLTLIHHYYIEGVSFPGQQSKFGFKDRALSQEWLNNPGITMISGHLHQSFAYKNYFCTGSVRATSPLENDQIKCLRKWNGNEFQGEESGVNYYFHMERPTESADLFEHKQRALKETDIINHRKSLQKKLNENFVQTSFPVKIDFEEKLDLKQVSLSIVADRLQYDNMSEFIDLSVQQNLQAVQLKRENASMEKLLEGLEKSDLSGSQSFGGWIELLKEMLKKQYPNEYEEYEKLLHEMKIC